MCRAGEVSASVRVITEYFAERGVTRFLQLLVRIEIVVWRRQRHHGIVLLILQRHGTAMRHPSHCIRDRGSADSHPAHGRWRAARGDGSRERYLGGVHELAEVHVREIERLADLVVAVAALVFGQQLLDSQAAQMQQVAQRVLEFLCGETAKQRASCLGDARSISIVEMIVEELQRIHVFLG